MRRLEIHKKFSVDGKGKYVVEKEAYCQVKYASTD